MVTQISFLTLFIMLGFSCENDLKILRLIYAQFSENDRILVYLNITRYNSQQFYLINQQIESSYLNVQTRNKTVYVLEKDQLLINNSTCERELFQEEIVCCGIKTSIFYYKLTEPPIDDYLFQGLSFSLHPKNESFSIMHQLKKTNQISQLIYAFGPPIMPIGYMYLGGVPSDIIQNRDKGMCKVNNNKWGCKLNNVVFTNKNEELLLSYNNKYKMIFQSAYKPIYAPSDFIDLLSKKLMKTYFDKNICYFKEFMFYHCKLIECLDVDDNLLLSLPTFISFEIDNYLYKIPFEKMYEFSYDAIEKKSFIKFLVVQSLNQDEEDYWILGGIFLTNFLSVFDYLKEEISFYSDIKSKSLIYSPKKIITLKIILISIVIICIINILLLFFLLPKGKKPVDLKQEDKKVII